MSDLQTLKETIAEDLGVDLDTFDARITAHIIRAINKYKRERFEFNERIFSDVTVADQEAYDFPADMLGKPDTVRITIQNDTPYPLRRIHWKTFQAWRVPESRTTGFPSEYAVYENRLFLMPIPVDVFALELTGILNATPEITATSAGDVSNFWTVEGEPLIAARATETLARGPFQWPERYATAQIDRREAFVELKRNARTRQATGKLKHHGALL